MSTRPTQNLLGLMANLADSRMLSLSQLAHLHFKGKRAARRRMQQLIVDGLVELIPGIPAQCGGRPENIYGLSKAGLQLLKSKSILDERLEFNQVDGRSLVHQIGHQLLLGWSRVHLVHLCRICPRLEFRIVTCNSPLALVPETGVPIVRTAVQFDEDNPPVYFEPDAAILLTDTEQPKSVLLFLEVDMGTEPVGTLREKILRYKQCFRSNGYKRYEKIWDASINGFRLLFLTDGDSGLKSLCSLTRSMAPCGFVWATSADQMFSEGISGCIWVSSGRTDQTQNSILDSLALPAPLPKLAN